MNEIPNIDTEVVLVEHTIKTPYIVSVNNMYEPIIRNVMSNTGKTIKSYHGIRLTAEASNLKHHIHGELNKSKIEISKSKINWAKPFSFTIVFVLAKGILRRDTGNMEKCVTDAIFQYLNLNDNRIFGLHQYKIYNTKGTEYVKFKLAQPNVLITDLII